ncbi:MAG: TIGR02147 family protein [Bdellovibrionota bacterium]|nr:TIGR02147 family protein [Bdellovibrionota bacterium]
MEMKQHYIQMLKLELESRKQTNSSYSMRAFARDLDMPAPHLSMLLSSKKGLSTARAEQILRKLNWSEEDKQLFTQLVESCHSRSQRKKQDAYQKLKSKISSLGRPFEKFIEDDEFIQISDPIHFQIIETLKLEQVDGSFESLRDNLNYSENELRVACERLLSLGYLKKEMDQYIVDEYKIVTSEKNVSLALRQHHAKQLKAGIDAIYHQDISERCLSSLTIAIPEDLIPEVFEKIQNFRKEINQFITDNPNQKKTKVYSLNTQFIKNTKEQK